KKGEETVNAAVAFEQYYDLGGKRSLELLAQNIHQKQSKDTPNLITILGQLKKWSAKYNWQQQIIQRERAIAEEKRKKREAQIEQMNDEHILIGRTQSLRAIKYIEELIKIGKFSSQGAVTLFKYATDLQRIAAGDATEQIALTGKDGGPIQTNG